MKKVTIALLCAFIGLTGTVQAAQENPREAEGQQHMGLFSRIKRRLGRGRRTAESPDERWEYREKAAQQEPATPQVCVQQGDNRSVRQWLLHNGLSLKELGKCVQAQDGQDPIACESIGDLSQAVVLPSSPDKVFLMSTIRALDPYTDPETRQVYLRDPYNRVRIPAWLADFVLYASNGELCALDLEGRFQSKQIERVVYDRSVNRNIEDEIDRFVENLKRDAKQFKAPKPNCIQLDQRAKAYLIAARRAMGAEWPEFIARLNSRLRRLYQERYAVNIRGLQLCQIEGGQIEPSGMPKNIFIYRLNQSLRTLDELLKSPIGRH